MLTRPQRQEAVSTMQTAGVSQRQACFLVGIWRGTYRYQSNGDGDEGLIRQRLRDLAAARPRFGSPRLGMLLRRELGVINHKRVERLYAKEGLQLPKRRQKLRLSFIRVTAGGGAHPTDATLVDGLRSDSPRAKRKFRTLTIVDQFCRECPTITVDTSISGQRVTRVLDGLAEYTGLPQVIVMDNGPEFTSKAMLGWAEQRVVKLHFIDPGKPTQNAYIESFNGKFRDECLNQHWFSDLQEARTLVEE